MPYGNLLKILVVLVIVCFALMTIQYAKMWNKSNISIHMRGMKQFVDESDENEIFAPEHSEKQDKQSSLSENRNQTVDNIKRYIFYSCVRNDHFCGGLADREKGIVTSYLAAEASGRKFGIAIKENRCPFSSYFDDKKITWDIPKKALRGLTSVTTVKMSSHRFQHGLQTINFDEISQDIMYLQTNLHGWDYFSKNERYKKTLAFYDGMTEDEVVRSVMYEVLPLSTKLQAKLDYYLQLGRPYNKSKLVCAHLRKGRNRDILKNATAVLFFLQKYMNDIQNRLFIAADHDNFRDQGKTMYPNRTIDTAGKSGNIDFARQKTDFCDIYEKAILDQRILAECDVLLISFSGFGRMAAFMKATNDNLFCMTKKGNIIPSKKAEIISIYGIDK